MMETKSNKTNWGPVFEEWSFERFREFAEESGVQDWNGYFPGCFDPPLMEALGREDGGAEMVRWLLDHGADPNAQKDDGHAPIHDAAFNGDLETARLLLERGAFVNQPDHHVPPWRPIHSAMGGGNADLVRYLVRSGAFVDCENDYGDTPMTITEWLGGCEGFAEILMEGLPGPFEPGRGESPTLYVLMGIPASGKSTFCRRVLGEEVSVVSLDALGTRAREQAAFDEALAQKRPVVVDDTNIEKTQRARWLAPAKAAGYRTVGVFFRSVLAECLARNEEREGDAKVKKLAVLGMSARLELPSPDEGFDWLFYARMAGAGLFEIEPWKEA